MRTLYQFDTRVVEQSRGDHHKVASQHDHLGLLVVDIQTGYRSHGFQRWTLGPSRPNRTYHKVELYNLQLFLRTS